MSSPKKKSRATLATVAFDPALRSSLVHLPLSLYAPLLERGVPPQSIVVEIARSDNNGNDMIEDGISSIHKIYTGWSGMSAAPLGASTGAFTSASSSSSTSSSSVSSVVSMSSNLATIFQPPLDASTSVKITLLRSPPLPIANRVDVVPLTPDDWEILSLNAEEVENNMLSQIRAAKEGMMIIVHVGRQGRTACRFRVASCDPPTQNYNPSDPLLPRAVRLSTNTEVVIAPRSRLGEVQDQQQAALQEHDLSANEVASSSSTNATPLTPASAQKYLAKALFRVLPRTFPAKIPLSPIAMAIQDSRILSLAFSGNSSGQGRCTVIKIPCPSAPEVFSKFAMGLTMFSLGSKHQSDAKVNKDATSIEFQLPARATTSAHFGSVDESMEDIWPARHIWLSSKTREKLGICDWDLIRFSGAAPSTSTSRPSSPEPEPGSDSVQSSLPLVAGVSKIVELCTSHIRLSFQSRVLRALQTSLNGLNLPETNSALLLTGGSGSGKTSIVKILSYKLSSDLVSTVFIDCATFFEERLSSMRHLISQWFSAAAWHSPTILILENLDRIIPSDQEHIDNPRSGQVTEFILTKIQEITREYAIFIVATCQSVNSLHKSCSSAHVFGETVDLKAPDKDARRDILNLLVQQRSFLQPEKDFNTIILSAQTEGYMPADLRDLVERAVHESAIRNATISSQESSLSLKMEDFIKAQKGFTPLSLRDIKLTQSNTGWKDIGGLQETRRVLRETLEWPSKYAKIFEKCPLRLRSGLLLYGYPGCGKTLLAGAVAKECGLNFISVKGPEILNKYIGASEKSVRDLFDRAQAAKPCILFFDEFDSIAPKRGHDSTGVTDRVVNQLLTQMDGAEGLSGVYILAATSRPDLIDSALLRPGRLDKSLLCDLPDEIDRLDILQVIANGKIRLDQSIDLKEWARRTEGYSGADLQALLYNANLEAVHENLSSADLKREQKGEEDFRRQGNGKNTKEPIKFFTFNDDKLSKTKLSTAEYQGLQKRMEFILSNANSQQQQQRCIRHSQQGEDLKSARPSIMVNQSHLENCFKTSRRSVPIEEQQRLKRIYQEFVGERDGKFPNGEGSREVGARQSLM